MIEIDLIYTFEKAEQIHFSTKLPQTSFENEETLSNTIKDLIPRRKRNGLRKVSCCAFHCKAEELPDWYFKCNGKLFFGSWKM